MSIAQKFIPPDIDRDELTPRELELLAVLEQLTDMVNRLQEQLHGLKRARQRLKAFLLSHGVRYTGRADWGPAHRRWLSAFSFDRAWQQLAFEEYRRTIEDRLAQCERLEAALREAVVKGASIRQSSACKRCAACSSPQRWACSPSWVICHASRTHAS